MMRERNRFGLTAKSFIFAVLVHGVVLAMLLVSFRWNTELVAEPSGPVDAEPVKATVVSEEQVQQQLAELKAEDERKRQEEVQRQQRLEEAQRKADEAEQRRKEETQRLAELEHQRKAEQEKHAVERKAEQEKAEKLAAERKAEEERLARIRKEKEQVEAERKAEQQRIAELEKQKELEAQRKVEEERRRAEDALQAKLEQERVTRRVNEAASHYVPLIQQKVSRNWRREGTCKSGLEVIVEVRLLPSGEVVSANVVRSSGDQACDRSVETAVWKASPLPISPDPSVYQQLFRQFNFRFKPDEKLLSQQ